MKPFPANRMKMYPVSTFVNNARNQGEKCIEPDDSVET
jgi:putative SOS response-associated peptidase YedK